MDIIERLQQPQLDHSVAVLCYDAAKEIEMLREALLELATTTFHSADDYRERAEEALKEMT
jgi:hypothetical protein